MKKKYIVLIAILAVFLTIGGIFLYERAHVSLLENDDVASVTITGGSDGPTSVFFAGKLCE